MRIVVALVLIASSMVGGRPAGAQEPVTAVASRILADSLADGGSRLAELPGASGLTLGYAIGTGEPELAIVAAASSAADTAWLDILRARIASSGSAAPGTYLMLLFDDDAAPADPEPGDPLIREPGLRAALADYGVDAVVLLDPADDTERLSLRAASPGRQSPRRVVEAARRAASAAGIDLDERPVSDFYAAAGLASGSAALGSWLAVGLPAIALAGTGSAAADTAALAGALAAELTAGRTGMDAIRGDDIAYLRYPLPGGSFILSDSLIVSAALIVLGTIAAALALGLLKGRRGAASVGAVSREAMAAFSLSFAALFGSRALSGLALAVAGAITGVAGAERAAATDGSPWGVALALAIRVLGILCAYYAVSGLGAKLGLHGDHRRMDAARAALALLCVDLIAATVLFPPVVPFLLAAFVVSAFASGRAVTAAAGLVAVCLVALPFVDPRVVASIGDARGGAGSVASAMLDAGFAGNAAIAAFVAPFGLWLVAASSSESHLRRGRRTAFFWLTGALACAAAETLARLA